MFQILSAIILPLAHGYNIAISHYDRYYGQPQMFHVNRNFQRGSLVHLGPQRGQRTWSRQGGRH